MFTGISSVRFRFEFICSSFSQLYDAIGFCIETHCKIRGGFSHFNMFIRFVFFCQRFRAPFISGPGKILPKLNTLTANCYASNLRRMRTVVRLICEERIIHHKCQSIFLQSVKCVGSFFLSVCHIILPFYFIAS